MESRDGIEHRREDAGALQPVRSALRRLAACEPRGTPRERERQRVADVVAGIGEHRERMRREADDHLRDDERGLESDADRECAPERRRRVSVIVSAIVVAVGVLVPHPRTVLYE